MKSQVIWLFTCLGTSLESVGEDMEGSLLENKAVLSSKPPLVSFPILSDEFPRYVNSKQLDFSWVCWAVRKGEPFGYLPGWEVNDGQWGGV